MKKIKFQSITILLFILSVAFISCEKENEADKTMDQLFRPPLFTAAVDGNEVTLSWTPIVNASYVLEVSRDNLLFQNELQVIPLENLSTYKLTDLWSSSLHSARIRSVSKDPAVKDSGHSQITFTTGVENIFFTTDLADITTTTVLLKWEPSKQVTDIEVSASGLSPYKVALSPTDNIAGQKLIGSLRTEVNYTFKIYKEAMLRGTIAVRTK